MQRIALRSQILRTHMALLICREAEDAADRVEKALLGGLGPKTRQRRW